MACRALLGSPRTGPAAQLGSPIPQSCDTQEPRVTISLATELPSPKLKHSHTAFLSSACHPAVHGVSSENL